MSGGHDGTGQIAAMGATQANKSAIKYLAVGAAVVIYG